MITLLGRLDDWLHNRRSRESWVAGLVCDFYEYLLWDREIPWRTLRASRRDA